MWGIIYLIFFEMERDQASETFKQKSLDFEAIFDHYIFMQF